MNGKYEMNNGIKVTREIKYLSCKSILYFAKQIAKKDKLNIDLFPNANSTYDDLKDLLEKDFYGKYDDTVPKEILEEADEFFKNSKDNRHSENNIDIVDYYHQNSFDDFEALIFLNINLENPEVVEKLISLNIFKSIHKFENTNLYKVELYSYVNDKPLNCILLTSGEVSNMTNTKEFNSLINQFKNKCVFIISMGRNSETVAAKGGRIAIAKQILTVRKNTKLHDKSNLLIEMDTVLYRQALKFEQKKNGWIEGLYKFNLTEKQITISSKYEFIIGENNSVTQKYLKNLEKPSVLIECPLALLKALETSHINWMWWHSLSVEDTNDMDENNFEILIKTFKLFIEREFSRNQTVSF